MNPQIISRRITRVLLNIVFFTVLIFSIFLADEITWNILLFSLFKGLVAVILAWLFFLILSDTLIKSIMDSVVDLQEKRRDGGLLFHFIRPGDNETVETQDQDKSGEKSKKG